MSKKQNNLIAKEIHQQFYKDKVGKIGWTDKWASPFYEFLFKQNNFNSILDIGCGNGSFLSLCKSKGLERCAGTDIITLDLGIVKKEENIEYYNIPASELSFNNNEFDIVTSFECLEHVHEDEVDATLDNMFKFTSNFLCLSIAHRESGEKTKDGRNLHLTVHPWHWWKNKLNKRGTIYSKLSPSDESRSYVIVSKRKTIYCDLDSTLNDHYNRIKRFTVEGKCDFLKASTEKELLKDLPLPHAIDSLNTLSKDFNIIILTARPFPNAQEITKKWLDLHNFYYDSIIVVKKSLDKIKYVDSSSSLFIDDLSRKHETNPPYKVLYQDTIEELEKRKINYILFKGDWKKVMHKLGYE